MRAEYERERIGVTILKRVREIVERTARRYPPSAYAETQAWNGPAFEALTQDFVLHSLLDDGQLDYVMSTAASSADFDRMMGFAVRRHLRRTRRRSIVDQLLDRARELLTKDPFEPEPDLPMAFRIIGTTPPARDAGPAALSAAIRRAALIPRRLGDTRERAPSVYSSDDLVLLLRVIAEELDCPVTLGHIRFVLSALLTEAVPSLLSSLDDGSADHTAAAAKLSADVEARLDVGAGGSLVAQRELPAEDQMLVTAAVSQLLADLSPIEQRVLTLKLAGASDTSIAQAVSMSRPTVATHKQRALAALEVAVADLDERHETPFTDALLRRLAEGVPHA